MARLLWDDAAEIDLDKTWDYIGREQQNAIAADRLITSLLEKAQLYSEQPMMGTLHEELGAGVRSFSVGNYVALYQPIEDGILVLRVFHGAQDYPSLFAEQ